MLVTARAFRLIVGAVLVVSLGFSGWQYSRRGRIETYWSTQYVGDLKNAVIRFDQLKGTVDPGQRSLEMDWIYGARRGGVSIGQVLDVMGQDGNPVRLGVLGRVEQELTMFSRDLWYRRGLKPPEAGSRQNDVLLSEDLDKLSQVWSIYRDQFNDAVVKSFNYDLQHRALVEAHHQLQQQGLTQLLTKPEVLNED